MPMHWRRIIDSIAFVLAVGIGAYIKYGLDGSWLAAISFAVLAFILTPYVITRVWGTYKLRSMQRRANEAVEKTEDDLKKRYDSAAHFLAKLLHGQTIFIGDVKLATDNGAINAKALGYIYGFTDCALQIAKLDIDCPFGIGVLLFLISEFDEPHADRLLAFAIAPHDNSAAAFLDGTMMGGNDYNRWASSQGKKTPINWAKCF